MEGLEHVSPLLRILIQGVDAVWAVRIYWLAIIVLCVLVYNLGFAKKLSVAKNIIVYAVLIVGSLLLLILSYQLPVVESLIAAALVLGIYKFRLKTHKEENQN
ncbi:YlaH-like family protein [Bacillus sp. B190/17]|uniref:YlaH-like family protein n=1 Tax=Bacillus lumedeiriae TaxID=3058829 RepID=A0ABW8I5V1_9BACI